MLSQRPDWEMPVFVALRAVVLYVGGYQVIYQVIFPGIEMLVQGLDEASVPTQRWVQKESSAVH